MAETPPQDDEQRDDVTEPAADVTEPAADVTEPAADVPERTAGADEPTADAREEGTDLADLPNEAPPGEPPSAPTAGVAAEQGTDEPPAAAEEVVPDVPAGQGTDEPAVEAEEPMEDVAADQPAAEPGGLVEAEVEAAPEAPAVPAPDAASGDAPGAEEVAADDEAIGAEETGAEETGAEETGAEETGAEEDVIDEAPAPRVRPEIPGADLEPDIVLEGSDPLEGRAKPEFPGADLEPDIVLEGDEVPAEEAEGLEDAPAQAAAEDAEPQTIAQATIDLAAGARYNATGKRKTSIARVILKPGGGTYKINGRPLDTHFPRPALQRNIRQPLETVGYESRMDVVATIQGGGVSSQAGALRHGIARALIDADPNLRSELKRRGFLTRDSRVKERKKAGLKKARKRPQFSKR